MTKRPRVYLVLNDAEMQAVRTAQAKSPYPIQTHAIIHTLIAAGIKAMADGQRREVHK